MGIGSKVNDFVKKWTKSDKIAQYRGRHSAVRHEYYTMANKYSTWDKKMLTFTIPSSVKNKRYKIGKYTKLKELLDVRAFIAKQFNNSKSDIKYFMNIELGKAYSNPHLHIQVWTRNGEQVSPPLPDQCLSQSDSKKGLKRAKNSQVGHSCNSASFWSKMVQYGKDRFSNKNTSNLLDDMDKVCDEQSKDVSFCRGQQNDKSITSSSTIDLIKKKVIAKFNLNESRCITTEPEKAIDVYHYVVKDYAKSLSDKELWALETQKKRMRSQIGKCVRFYSKSGDVLTKRLYRIAYYCYGVVRNMADEFLIDLKNKMFYFTKRNLPQLKVLELEVSYLGYIEQEGYLYVLLFIFWVEYACLDPPFMFFAGVAANSVSLKG